MNNDDEDLVVLVYYLDVKQRPARTAQHSPSKTYGAGALFGRVLENDN